MNEPLSEVIRIRVTPSHAARLGEAAALSGLSLSNYIHRRLAADAADLPTGILRQRTAWATADGAKSGHARPVPLNDDAMSVVTGRLPHAGKHIFTRPGSGGRISQIDARCLNRACRSVEITDFRFHDLRHTWASWHVQNGTPLLVLKELGGWETLEMVQRYAHLAPSHLASHASAVTFWSRPAADFEPPELAGQLNN